MKAGDLFKVGKLQEAIDLQIREVKANPGDPNRRLFLFELIAFTGDLDKARKQLEAISYGQLELDTVVGVYGKVLEAEETRRRFVREGVPPQFFAEPPEYVRWQLEATQHLREKRVPQAAELLIKALAASPTLNGKWNDKPFNSLRDGDDLFAAVLEVFGNGKYWWVPLEQIQTVTMNPPKYPRDLLWVPAWLEPKDYAPVKVFLPVLYPASYESNDNEVKMGRLTQWQDLGDGPVLGVGQHSYFFEEQEVGLLDWRELIFD
jgi:type VI secretion system protein ImpE